MRNPARLFAAALITAMAVIAAVALLVDLSGRLGGGSRHDVAPTVQRAGAARSVDRLASAIPTGPGPTATPDPGTQASPAVATDSPATSTQPGAPAAAGTGRPADTRPRPTAGAAAHASTNPAASSQRAHPSVRRPSAVRRAPAPTAAGPGAVSRSHYLRHVSGIAAIDVPRMLALGGSDGLANASGQRHVVLLDIGGQRGDGVQLSTTPRWVSYDGLVRALIAYVQGYHATQRRNAPVTIAIGTNNDLQTSAWTGQQWAQRVVEPVRRAAAGYKKMVIAGADDIEPGFHASVRQTRSWVDGFLAATEAPLVFNGSADGCPTDVANGRCGRHWTAADLAWVAGGAAKRISALPQVYSTVMARQWAMIALTAVDRGYGALRFRGPLTENAACRGVKSCPTMGSAAAWNALSSSLRAVGTRLQPSRSDLDVK